MISSIFKEQTGNVVSLIILVIVGISFSDSWQTLEQNLIKVGLIQSVLWLSATLFMAYIFSFGDDEGLVSATVFQFFFWFQFMELMFLEKGITDIINDFTMIDKILLGFIFMFISFQSLLDDFTRRD